MNRQSTLWTATQPASPAVWLGLSAIAGLLLLLMLTTQGIDLPWGKALILTGLAMGGVMYWLYWQFVTERPQLLTVFMLILWPVVEYFNHQLLSQLGINLHLRPLLILALGLPGLWLLVSNAPVLLGRLPHLKYYFVFFAWLVLYFVVYNANAADPRLQVGGNLSEGAVGVIQATSYFYGLIVIGLSGLCVLRASRPQVFFDTFNKVLLIVSSLMALVTLIGYPFGVFSMPLDGFTRATGIFTHPNPFAHHMGMLLVYFLGLLCYYQGERSERLSFGWLLTAFLINLGAFLLGLSKTAIGVFGMCSLLILALNIFTPGVRRYLLRVVIAGIVLVPIGLLLFEVTSGHSFFDILAARMEQTQSYTWRTEVWDALLADVNFTSIWLGHGITAANAQIFQYSYSDAANAKPLMMVHNGYLNLIYDFGVMGYLFFAGVLSLVFQSLYRFITGDDQTRPLYATILGMTLYFLVVAGFDEMTYMFDAPLLFWGLSSMLLGLGLREKTA